MKVLISYFAKNDSIPLGFSCVRGFEQLGIEARLFDSQAEHPVEQYFIKYVNKLLRGLTGKRFSLSQNRPFSNDRYRAQCFERSIADFQPDLLLVIRGNSYDATFLNRMREQYGVQVVGWWVKEPRDGDEMIRDAQLYDQYFSIHQFGYHSETDHIQHLPALGYDPVLYPEAISRTDADLIHDVVLVGGYSPRRHQMFSQWGDLPLSLYGPGWRKGGRMNDPLYRRSWVRHGIWGDSLIDLYQRSKIVLNITSWDTAKLSGQNLRLYDVPATGAFLITDDTEEVRDLFKVGEEIEVFRSAEELADKVRFYLQKTSARETIAKKGCERVKLFPRYADRMQVILTSIAHKVGN